MTRRLLISSALLTFLLGAHSAHAADPSGPFAPLSVPQAFAGARQAMPDIRLGADVAFRPWTGGPAAIGSYNPDYFTRTRRGSVEVASGISAHIDYIQNENTFPSWYEIVSADKGQLMARFAVTGLAGSELFFAGQGVVYLRQQHMSLCGPFYTRRFALRGQRLVEQKQALYYIGADTEVVADTPLYQAPDRRVRLGVLPAGSQASVIGIQPGRDAPDTLALLVRSPEGLSGWHVPGKTYPPDGSLAIYLCN